MSHWTNALVAHNHNLHAFIVAQQPPVEMLLGLVETWMAAEASKTEQLPFRVQRNDENGVTRWEVSNGEVIAVFDSEAEADAEVLQRLPTCPQCAEFAALMEAAQNYVVTDFAPAEVDAAIQAALTPAESE